MAGQGDSNLTRLERMERRLQSLEDAEAINRATRPCATTTIRRMGTLPSCCGCDLGSTLVATPRESRPAQKVDAAIALIRGIALSIADEPFVSVYETEGLTIL